MSSAAKKTKFGPSAKPPTCKYEKARRDRLNLIITELSTFLPEQNPAKSLSKIDILEKIVHLIKQLLDDKEKLSNKNSADECLKQELKELRSTVSDLKARIVALNKILSSAKIAVPIDLEVPCFDKSFTPHLRYSNRKRAVTCQSTQTEQEQPNSKPEEQKENEDESAEKLIAFTKKLKAPLKEIQVNITQAQPVPPTQIIIVPYYYPTPSPMIPRRPAMTQLTYSNKRPISSYTDFKRIYSEQQEKLERKRRRRRQKRKPSLLGGKKCTCKSVVLKKPDGALKKIIKLCGYKTCKNKTKFERIQEQAKQQQSEKAKEDKAKETQSAITVSKDNAEDKTKMQVNDAMYPGVVSEPCYYPCSNYFNTNYQPNMKHNHTSHGTVSDCPNEASNVKSDQRNIATKTQNVNHDITCSNMMVRHSIDSLNHKSSVNQDTEDNTRHEINHVSHIESYNSNTNSMEQRGNTMVHDMPNSSNGTSRISNNNVGCYNASSDTNNRINSNVASYNPSIGTNNRTSSSTNNSYIGSNETNNRINGHVNTDESYKNTNDTNNRISTNMGSYKHSNETNNRIGINVGYYNSSSDSTSRINNNVNNESSYNSNDTNTRINSNIINVGSYKGSNNTGNSINGHSNTENSYNSSSDSNNRINSHVNTENSYNSNDTNNRVSNNVNNVGSYSINNVMSSSKTHTGDSPYQTQPNSSAIFQKVQHGEESNNANLNKRQVRKNLNFSFENLGSNVMSSDTNTCFGSNENTSGVLYPLPGQHDNTYNTPFSYKTNTLPSSDMSYVEPCQEKTSCYFESHPNALHFPTTSVTKPFDETKRKSGLKQKPDASSNTCHDISQNIFEVNNKENSFDFLFGKQNSLNTPQKSKRKSDSCLMSEKTFLLDEMRFHSDFSNDLFSLPGQVGGQNLECVSPTAAFLLTFPLVSSKHTELLTDNIESGNTATPIGNMESLSQDLFPPQTDFSFKSNMKGLFDPFYSSCIGTELNVLDNVAKDDLLGKSNFPSCSENTGTGTAWSANIFNNEESPKKKTLADSTSQLLSLDKTKKHVEMKLSQSSSRSQDINSKCSQTPFSYAESSDVVSTSKSLVNWMTSSDKNTVAIQNEKKPSDKFTWSPNKALPIEPVLMFPPPTSTNFALTPSTTKTNSFAWQDGKDPSSSSTLGFFADSKNVTHSHTKDKTQEHNASHFSSNTIEVPISQCNENKTSSQTYSNNTRTDVKYNSSKLKEHSDKDNTNNSKSRKSLFDENPDKSIQYYYPNPPTSNSSSFLSVSQLVDPNKPASKDKTQSYTTKSNAIKKEAKFPSNLKEPIENNNKYKNYSTEALLSSEMPPPSSKTYKPVETKIRYKRKRNDNKASKITPGNLTNIYNVATTSSSALYSNSNYYVPPTTVSYYMGSASNEQNWNPSYSNSTNSSYDAYDNTTNKYLETSRENNVPSANQNYFPSNTSTLAAPCCKSSSTSHYQNSIITSANHPGHSYVTSASYIPKYHNVTNTSHSTSKSSSISVGTQVVTSSFPCLPTNQNKVVLSGSNFSLSSSSNSTSCLKSTPQSSTASVLPSWHIPVSVTSCNNPVQSTLSYASTSVTRSTFVSTSTSSLAMSPSHSTTSLVAMPAISCNTSLHTNSKAVPVTSTSLASSKCSRVTSSSSSISVSSTSGGLNVKSIPPPIPSIISTSVTYSGPGDSSLVPPSSYLTETSLHTGRSSDMDLYTSTSSIAMKPSSSSSTCLGSTREPHASLPTSISNNVSSSSMSSSNSLSFLRSSMSSSVGTALNTPVTSSKLSSASNASVTSSSSAYTSRNTPISVSKLSNSAPNTSGTSSSLFYSLNNTTITSSSLSYTAFNTPITSSKISYSALNPSVSSSSLYYSLDTPITSSISSYVPFNIPLTTSSGSFTTLNTPFIVSKSLNSGSNTSVTSSCLFYSHNTTITSSSLSHTSLITPVTSSKLSYSALNSAVTASTSSYVPLNIPGTSSNLSTSSFNTFVTSSKSSSSLNTSVNSSGLTYAGLNTSVTSSTFYYPPLNTPISSSNLSYASLTTPITSSKLSYSAANTSVTSSNFYYSLNTSITSSSLSYASHNTPITSSNLSYSVSKTPVTSFISYTPFNTTSKLSSSSLNTPVTSKLSDSSLNIPANSSSLSYSGLNTSVTSSNLYYPLNAAISSSSLPYAPFNPPITSSKFLYSAINNSVSSSSLSYASLNTSVNSSSSYASINTPITSSKFSYSAINNSVSSSSLSYASLNMSVNSSSSYASINTPITSSKFSYSAINTVTSSSLSYSVPKTSVTSFMSYASLNTPVTTSKLSSSSLNTPANPSFSYSSHTPITSSISYSRTTSSAASSSTYSVPYSSTALYPPVTSSVTDFNLSTIFPEINDKDSNQTSGVLNGDSINPCSRHVTNFTTPLPRM